MKRHVNSALLLKRKIAESNAVPKLDEEGLDISEASEPREYESYQAMSITPGTLISYQNSARRKDGVMSARENYGSRLSERCDEIVKQEEHE